jgi:hypothetical protein
MPTPVDSNAPDAGAELAMLDARSPHRLIAGGFAIAAFSIALLAGLASGRDAASIMGRAVLALVCCYPIGYIISWAAMTAVKERLRQLAADRPVPRAELEQTSGVGSASGGASGGASAPWAGEAAAGSGGTGEGSRDRS